MADTKISALTAATSLAMADVAPVVQSGSTKKASVEVLGAALAAAGDDWATAGGSAPAFGAVDLGGGATAITLGTGPVVQSSFIRLGGDSGSLCFGHARIHQDTDGTGGTGAWTLTGLPVAPAYQQEGFDGGQNVGWGFIIDLGDSFVKVPVDVVLDPNYSTTQPVIFPRWAVGTAPADDTGDGSAGDIDVCVPVHVNDNTHLANGTHPFDFAGGAILNVTLLYQAVAA